MIINPALPSGFTVFADDIRREVGGKITLVGTYNNTMYVGHIPAALPKLCCMVVLRLETSCIDSVQIRVTYEVPGEVSIVAEAGWDSLPELELPSPSSDAFRMRELKMFFELAPFEINEAGNLKVRAYYGEDEVRLGVLKISTAPQNTQGDDDGDRR